MGASDVAALLALGLLTRAVALLLIVLIPTGMLSWGDHFGWVTLLNLPLLGLPLLYGAGAISLDHAIAAAFRRRFPRFEALPATAVAGLEGGMGVLSDDIEAVKWYRRAADTGDDLAQYHMGIMHVAGRGVPRDLVMAYMWLDLAAMQGHQGATTARDSLAGSVSAAQVAEAQKLARGWKPKSER